MKFETLYKQTQTGGIQFWEIATEGNVIITRWGRLDGKVQEGRDVVREGKNAGRANSTTPEQQADAEAQSMWERKLKRDYVRTLAGAEAGDNQSELVEGGVLPMLAHRFDKHPEKIAWPCYVQPKLDGHRCMAVVDKAGKCELWSRSRKRITSMPHIVAAVEDLELSNVVLDGELYNAAYADHFEELTSFIRQSDVKPGHEVVEYHIYDVVSNQSFANRTAWIAHQLVARGKLVPVETRKCYDQDQMDEWFGIWTEAGYEGLMVRNVKGGYKHGRSYDLQKVKAMLDSEYEIVGVSEGRGKLAGHGIFTCRMDNGTTFDVKMAGKLDELRKYFEEPDKWIGKMLTVQYQALTGANGVPRFPVGLRIRNDI